MGNRTEGPKTLGSQTPVLPPWDDTYPSQAELRREIAAITEAFLDALLSTFPHGAIEGVYWKGSSLKHWDSPLDYVPELSDVDLHVLFADDRPDEIRYFHSVEMGLQMQRRLEEGFSERVPHPIHVPRVQLVVANALHRQPNFVPTPSHTTKTLFGRPDAPVEVDPIASRTASINKLIDHEEYLEDLGGQVADKPDKYLWAVLRTMTWRVGPTGPRVLEVLGMPYQEAWSMNRTAVALALRSMGEEKLAETYARYYLEEWSYFLSGYQDGAAVRAAILAGAQVLARGAEIGRNS